MAGFSLLSLHEGSPSRDMLQNCSVWASRRREEPGGTTTGSGLACVAYA